MPGAKWGQRSWEAVTSCRDTVGSPGSYISSHCRGWKEWERGRGRGQGHLGRRKQQVGQRGSASGGQGAAEALDQRAEGVRPQQRRSEHVHGW